jgi:hypothetical protein
MMTADVMVAAWHDMAPIGVQSIADDTGMVTCSVVAAMWKPPYDLLSKN